MRAKPYRRDFSDYNEEFVGRDNEIKTIVNWAQNSAKRVLIITGPPGIGKTWVLNKALPEINSSSDKRPLWVDVPKPENLSSWLEDFLDKVRKDHPETPAYDPIPQPGILLQKMAETLCQKLEESVYFIFDRGDELYQGNDRDDWRKFERIIIEPLGRIKCVRFIISLHDDQRIRTPALRLSSTDLPLEGFREKDTGLAHVSRLLPKVADNSLNVTPKKVYDEFLPGYNWEHPGLNAILMKKRRMVTNILSLSDYDKINFISEVLAELLNSLPPELEQSIELLSKVSQYLRENDLSFFTPTIIVEIANLSVTEAWDKIDEWQGHHLIHDDDGGFKIQEGLYELLLVLKPLTNFPEEGSDNE